MKQVTETFKNTESEKKRIDKYVKFVIFFNKFINHRKKNKHIFVERDMRI